VIQIVSGCALEVFKRMIMGNGKTMRITTKWLLPVTLLCVATASPAYAKKSVPTGDSGVERELKFKLGDEPGNEVKALKTELLVIKSEKKALEQLVKLQKKYENTRMEPEILFRLAELYMRRARSERFFEVHKNSEEIMSFVPNLVKAASETAEIRKAIAHYQRIQEKYPRFRATDVVLFNSAYAYQQIGDDHTAEGLFDKLIKLHPSSQLVPDAYLSVGEINFKARTFQVALENFRAIRKFPKARVYPYGLYKAAWTYYNLQDANSGMTQLEEVIAYGHEVVKNSWDSKLDLRKEALGDLALFYSDTKPSKSAVDYLRLQAQELDSSIYIMRLAELYKRHARFADVEIVLKDLLAKMPDSEAVASAHEELVWNYERTKRQGESVDQLVAFDSYCEASAAKALAILKKKNSKAELPRTECQTKISETSKKLASKWHALWKKFSSPDSGQQLASSAEKAYRLYLKTALPKDADTATVRYAFAELMFARKQYREASDNYAMIEEYQKQGIKVDQKVSHDAAYAATVSLERAAGDKWNDEDEKRFNVLAENYLSRNKNGQYSLELRFKRGFIAYEKERYDEAAPQFKKIGWEEASLNGQWPEKVVKAQDLYLDILNIKKDFKGIKEATQQLLSRSNTQDATRSGHIEKLYREAYFAEIQQREEKGDLPGAVDAYKKFALENAASDLAPKAWWNASQLQFRLGDAQGGANTCYQMHKLFPNSSNGKECLTKAATTFEAMGRLDLAARVLLNLATVEPDNQNKWREVAADFFALSGSAERAIPMYLSLAETLKGDKQVHMLEKAAQLAKDTSDAKSLALIEAQFTSKGIEPQASRLVVEQAEQAFEQGDQTKAFNMSKRIISRDSLPKELQARARFIQARVLEDEYRKQSVKARVERIGTVLALKTEKLEKAQKAFQSAIRYGDAGVSVKSLKRLGDCYIDYAKTVRSMTLPASISAADQQAFKAEIEQLSIPMEEKGIESMAQALDTAKKAQLRDGQIADLQVELGRLNMKPITAPAVTVAAPLTYLPQFTSRAPASNKEVVR
jgi:TolA-binding protein